MANWQNGVTALNEDNMNALYDLRKGSTSIASNTDLDDLTTAGTYRCDNRTIATTLVNCPVSIGFKMVVDCITASTVLRQTIIVNNANADTWVRTKSADSWGDWHQVATTDNSYYLGIGNLIASGTDLNNLTSIGAYYSDTVAITNSLVNCPVTDAGFKLIVEYTTATNRIVQTIKVNNINKSTTYVRTNTGSWGVWRRLVNSNEIEKSFVQAVPSTEATLTNSSAKISLGTIQTQYDPESYLLLSDGGILCSKAGIVQVSASLNVTGLTSGDNVGMYIYQNSSNRAQAVMKEDRTSYILSLVPRYLNVSAGDIIYLYAVNATGARGNVVAGQNTRLNIEYMTIVN